MIKLSTRIKKINAANGADGKVVVTTEKGDALQFDEIVVTAPLGWLKQNQEAFTPSLPPRFSSAIDSIGYGCLEKVRTLLSWMLRGGLQLQSKYECTNTLQVYISFPRAFWLSSTKVQAPNGQLDSNHSDPDAEISGFSQFLAPTYSPLNPKRWIQEMLELGTLPDACAHPTLLFYIFGDQSCALTTDLRLLPPSKERHELLVNFFRPHFSRLPNYSDSTPDCTPTSSYATEWLNDDLAGNGSYSYFPTGLEEGDKDIEVMREGLPGRGIWFAGEHTAPFVASGTVTGAYWSGEGVGKRIAEAYDMAKEIADGTIQSIADGVGSRAAEKGGNQEVNILAFADLMLEN
jgi:hypothetical protein